MLALETPGTVTEDGWCGDMSSCCYGDALFPESRFSPPAEWQDSYASAVADGYQRMQTRQVVIAALARNVAWFLPRTIARIERLGSLFGGYRVVVYENDSADQTPRLLDEWSRRNPRVTVLSEVRHDEVNRPVRCRFRAQRMAYYRAQYHRFIAAEHADYDDVIVVDMDLAEGWSCDGIANTFGQGEWDFVGSYGILYRRLGMQHNRFVHYDSWAFRTSEDFRPMATREVNAMRCSRGEPMISVYSCFGGMGVYRMAAFLSGRYEGPDCEHVAMHRRMRAHGYRRTFLNPSQIAIHGLRHRRLDPVIRFCQTALDLCTLRSWTAWY
jgi:hypothetical protein